MVKMQSPILNSARHHPAASRTVRRPVVRLRVPSHVSGSNSNSNHSSPSPILPKMDYNWEPETIGIDQTSNPETSKIMRNSLYLTFNAPQVDDYHRGIFLTHPPAVADASHKYSGTLLHASYAPPPEARNTPATWFLEERPVSDVSTSTSLVLLFKIGTLDPNSQLGSIEEQCRMIRSVLDDVPLGRQNRESQLGPLAVGQGNPVLEGYDCVIWTIDAMDALARANIISLEKLECTDGGKQPRDFHTKFPNPKISQKYPGLPRGSRSRSYSGRLHEPDPVPPSQSFPLFCCLPRRCFDGHGMQSAQVMAKARALAGPADARTMVGKDFGGLRVVN